MSGEQPVPWNATVVRRRDASDRVAVLWVRPDAGRVQAFEPGQFVQIGWPRPPAPDAPPGGRLRWIKRSYSIASAPGEHDAYELCIALVDEGQLTTRLWPLQVGDRVWCDDAPKGQFTLGSVPHGAPIVALATGTGIAPYVSMLRHFRGSGRWSRFTIVHGARERGDLAYEDGLSAAEGADASVRYVPVLSREPEGSGWTGLRGRVQAALPQLELPGDAHVLLCGNPAMIEDVRALLLPRGFQPAGPQQPGNLHYERYW